MKNYLAFAAAALLSLVVPVHAETPTKNVVEIAAGNSDFSTLVAAVKAAGLAETLSGKGPFTIFAPTNAAFAKLPAGTVEGLLKPENKEKLAGILTYHVVAAKVLAVDVPSGLDCDTGQPATHTVRADHTCTFAAMKIGFTQPAAKPYIGTVHVCDIGVPPTLITQTAGQK